MPTVNASLIPTITPGNLFDRFTTDASLNIRWLTALDPVFFEVLNRPDVDIVVRQLILAKAVDQIELRLSHQSLFPFLVTPKVKTGTEETVLPLSWIWDMHVSLPAKWELLRLMKIKRISGTNIGGSAGDAITGKLRLVFSAQQKGSASEVAMFFVDYLIDSVFTYQLNRITIADSAEEPNPIDPGEATTVDGFVTFRTQNLADAAVQDFFKKLAPPDGATDSDSDGIFDVPAVYEMVGTGPGGITTPDDFLEAALDHGTGILVDSAWNAIPDQNANVNSWLEATNFPFRIGASRTAVNGITVPKILFTEMSITAPERDEASDDDTRQNFPVWLSSIERLDDLASSLKITFSTHSIDPAGVPKDVEFGTLTLERSMAPGTVVDIVPSDDLLGRVGTESESFMQGFGSGHVVLSSLWGATTDEVDNFFNSFLAILDVPPLATFTQDAGILSFLSVDRSPRWSPTRDQFSALAGSTARREVPVNPSDDNRYVTEKDDGLGDAIDFRTKPGFPDELRENPHIEPVGYVGGLVHPIVKLVVDAEGLSADNMDYETHILPRLTCLLGRNPEFSDFWFDGTLLKFFTGNAWISL